MSNFVSKPNVTAIAIVGGGMVGALTALLFSRHLPSVSIKLFDRLGASFDVQDAQVSPSFDGRSTAIAPTTQKCFSDLGLWESITPFATPINEVHISDKGHAGQGLFDGGDNKQSPLGFVVQNAGLGQVLAAALKADGNVETFEKDVDAVKVGSAGAAIMLADGSSAYYELVVIADGANSRLRRQLGISVEASDYEQSALVANVRHSKAHQLTAYERFTSRGPIALLPIGGHASSVESTLVWTCPNSQLSEYQAMTQAQRLKTLQREFGFRLGYFEAMSEPVFYPLHRIIAEEQVRSHIVMMGNAAHFLHPVAGQGFNLSVRDALRLTSVLRCAANKGEQLGSLSNLSEYQAQQIIDQRNTINLGHGFNRIFTNAPLVIEVGRTLGLLALELNPQIRGEFISHLSGRAQPATAL